MLHEPPVILLVEAEEPLARVIISYLERDGYRVQCVASLASALAAGDGGQAEGVAPELVLLDVDGSEAGLVGGALEGATWRRVILLTSDHASLRWARGQRSEGGGISVLDKPFAMR